MTVENAEERRRLLQERRQFALEYSKERKRPYDKVKRVCDIIGSFVLLIFFVIVLPIFALCIKLDSRGPVFFVQERVGKDMRLFRMYKFRTMVYDCLLYTSTQIKNPKTGLCTDLSTLSTGSKRHLGCDPCRRRCKIFASLGHYPFHAL